MAIRVLLDHGVPRKLHSSTIVLTRELHIVLDRLLYIALYTPARYDLAVPQY
jgi:hypothetical protein